MNNRLVLLAGVDLFGRLSELEEPLFRYLNHAGASPLADAFFLVLTLLGASYILVWLAPAMWFRGRRELAVDLLVVLAIVTIVVEIVKFALGRDRPLFALDNVSTVSMWGLTSASGPSFPSAHAARAFAVGTLISFQARRPVVIVALLTAGLIGISRVYFGLHWPSDVVVGAVVGSTTAAIIRHAGTGWPKYIRAREAIIRVAIRLFEQRGKAAR